MCYTRSLLMRKFYIIFKTTWQHECETRLTTLHGTYHYKFYMFLMTIKYRYFVCWPEKCLLLLLVTSISRAILCKNRATASQKRSNDGMILAGTGL